MCHQLRQRLVQKYSEILLNIQNHGTYLLELYRKLYTKKSEYGIYGNKILKQSG
jgi:hypothetical protein